jgi:hypothetical protein
VLVTAVPWLGQFVPMCTTHFGCAWIYIAAAGNELAKLGLCVINADNNTLHVQGDAGLPGSHVGAPKKNNRKKWGAEEEERHSGLLTKKPR